MATKTREETARTLVAPGKGIGGHISGVILFNETIRRVADGGRSFVDVRTPTRLALEANAEARYAASCQLVRCLGRSAPAAVPGTVLLSGGQSDELATAHRNAMNHSGACAGAYSPELERRVR